MKVLVLTKEESLYSTNLERFDVIAYIVQETSGMHFSGRLFNARVRAESRVWPVMKVVEEVVRERLGRKRGRYFIDSLDDGYMVYGKAGRDEAVLCVENCIMGRFDLPHGKGSEKLRKLFDIEVRTRFGPEASFKKVRELLLYSPLITLSGEEEFVMEVISALEGSKMPSLPSAFKLSGRVEGLLKDDEPGRLRLLDVSARLGWLGRTEVQMRLNAVERELAKETIHRGN